MTKREDEPDIEMTPARENPGSVNPGYAVHQIARALTTSEEHDDPATRERARQKISKWVTVLENIMSGSVQYGSRTPVEAVPAWATLEVVTGGFATGELLAGGPLQQHEESLLKNLQAVEGEQRRALNSYFLTDAGLEELQKKLQTGGYDIGVPEEGALMVVAWLVKNGHREEARELLSDLSPYFPQLRFYPIPLDHARRFGSRVHLQDVGSTINDLQKMRPNQRILAQKEAAEVWAPWYDRMVALFLETVADEWPCRQYPEGWSQRALALLGEYSLLRIKNTLCRKPDRARGHFAQLREFLGRCATKPDSLTGREVGRIRLILTRYVEKRGAPNSPACAGARHRQLAYVSGPTFLEIAGVVVPRLAQHSSGDGLDDVNHLKVDVSKEEAATFGVPEHTAIPVSIQRKVERCLNETVEVLIERGLVTSGEALARVLPQMISGLRAAGISDPELRQLYASVYRAFRRRRSLLLLNLESQVQMEELPWVKAVDRFRAESLSTRELSRQALEEVTLLSVTSFPHAILPNKLLQELRALAKGAELDIPLVDEVAADIFMGQFSGKFVESAKRAANLMEGTLYTTYYGIDYGEIRKLPKQRKQSSRSWPWSRPTPGPDPFAQLCASRAGVELGLWDAATNGMIIEQQQILTTQNLAALFSGLDLTEALRDQLEELARKCFLWICKRQQTKLDRWHDRLIMLKNTAYAWRQMVFFLSLLPRGKAGDCLDWAERHLEEQPEEFRNRFRPALNGLAFAAEGRSLETAPAGNDVRRFLGWSKARHWLLPEPAAGEHRLRS